MSTALILQVLSYVVPLLIGYLLRHFNIKVPGLPAPVPTPASTPASPADHVGLLQQVLGVAREEAQALLKQAVQDVLARGLSDLKAAADKDAPKGS